ncbi:MAG: hypothetical protein KBD63_04750 [Bacteriovoracaceae bacterium]|nr:hypothetical protein [Bacteriovoracaceae bacterium]
MKIIILLSLFFISTTLRADYKNCLVVGETVNGCVYSICLEENHSKFYVYKCKEQKKPTLLEAAQFDVVVHAFGWDKKRYNTEKNLKVAYAAGNLDQDLQILNMNQCSVALYEESMNFTPQQKGVKGKYGSTFSKYRCYHMEIIRKMMELNKEALTKIKDLQPYFAQKGKSAYDVFSLFFKEDGTLKDFKQWEFFNSEGLKRPVTHISPLPNGPIPTYGKIVGESEIPEASKSFQELRTLAEDFFKKARSISPDYRPWLIHTENPQAELDHISQTRLVTGQGASAEEKKYLNDPNIINISTEGNTTSSLKSFLATNPWSADILEYAAFDTPEYRENMYLGYSALSPAEKQKINQNLQKTRDNFEAGCHFGYQDNFFENVNNNVNNIKPANLLDLYANNQAKLGDNRFENTDYLNLLDTAVEFIENQKEIAITGEFTTSLPAANYSPYDKTNWRRLALKSETYKTELLKAGVTLEEYNIFISELDNLWNDELNKNPTPSASYLSIFYNQKMQEVFKKHFNDDFPQNLNAKVQEMLRSTTILSNKFLAQNRGQEFKKTFEEDLEQKLLEKGMEPEIIVSTISKIKWKIKELPNIGPTYKSEIDNADDPKYASARRAVIQLL